MTVNELRATPPEKKDGTGDLDCDEKQLEENRWRDVEALAQFHDVVLIQRTLAVQNVGALKLVPKRFSSWQEAWSYAGVVTRKNIADRLLQAVGVSLPGPVD